MDDATQCLLDGLIDSESAGAVVNWAGGEVPCCGGEELGGKLLQAGGFRMSAQVTVVLRLDLFAGGAAAPQEKQRLTYTSAPGATARALRIDTRTIFRNALLILECNDPNEKL